MLRRQVSTAMCRQPVRRLPRAMRGMRVRQPRSAETLDVGMSGQLRLTPKVAAELGLVLRALALTTLTLTTLTLAILTLATLTLTNPDQP